MIIMQCVYESLLSILYPPGIHIFHLLRKKFKIFVSVSYKYFILR